jgi:nitroreductase
MKNLIFYSGILSAVLLCGAAKALVLPPADLSSPILKTIDARKSTRNFSSKPVSEQTLSNILWAAFGTNSHNTRTIPTAMNQQDLKVFVIYNNNVWQYDGKNNKLVKLETPDLMPFIAKQGFVKDAPVQLIYAGGQKFADVHSGSAYENVSLYAAEQGLASVVRGSIDREALHKALNLADDEIVTFNQVIGYPAE